MSTGHIDKCLDAKGDIGRVVQAILVRDLGVCDLFIESLVFV